MSNPTVKQLCSALELFGTRARGEVTTPQAVTAQSSPPLQAALPAASAALLVPMKSRMGARQRIRLRNQVVFCVARLFLTLTGYSNAIGASQALRSSPLPITSPLKEMPSLSIVCSLKL